MINTNQNKVAKKLGSLQAGGEIIEPKPKTIKLRIDVRLDRYVVVRITPSKWHTLKPDDS